MDRSRVILVTGVAGFWGREVARALISRQVAWTEADSSDGKSAETSTGGMHIIGVDNDPLPEAGVETIEGLDFIQVDIQNPLFVELLKKEEVHTVCHLDFTHHYHRSEKAFVENVLGTMKLVGACAEAGVRKLVFKSSTMVYGASWNNPAFLTEAHPIQGSKGYGYTRDMVEIESFCTGFCQQSPDMIITRLRFPSIIGPRSATPMNQYLGLKLIPVLFGFDPMMQVVHESDVIQALVHGVEHDIPGTFNVAAEGVLPLRGIIGRAGKLPLPIFHPLAYVASDLISVSRLPISKTSPLEWDYLRYRWVADITRMREEFKFSPQYSAQEALADLARHQKLSHFNEERAEYIRDEEYLKEIMNQRNRLRVGDGEGH